MSTLTPENLPSDGEEGEDPWKAKFQRAFQGSRRVWDEYVQKLPEGVRESVTEVVSPQPDVFFYDSVSALATLIGSALVYHSAQLINDHGSELELEMFELGNRLLTTTPDDTPMGQEYSDWLDGTIETMFKDGIREFPPMTPEQEASLKEFEANLAEAEQQRQRDLARAVELLPRLWH